MARHLRIAGRAGGAGHRAPAVFPARRMGCSGRHGLVGGLLSRHPVPHAGHGPCRAAHRRDVRLRGGAGCAVHTGASAAMDAGGVGAVRAGRDVQGPDRHRAAGARAWRLHGDHTQLRPAAPVASCRWHRGHAGTHRTLVRAGGDAQSGIFPILFRAGALPALHAARASPAGTLVVLPADRRLGVDAVAARDGGVDARHAFLAARSCVSPFQSHALFLVLGRRHPGVFQHLGIEVARVHPAGDGRRGSCHRGTAGPPVAHRVAHHRGDRGRMRRAAGIGCAAGRCADQDTAGGPGLSRAGWMADRCRRTLRAGRRRCMVARGAKAPHGGACGAGPGRLAGEPGGHRDGARGGRIFFG